MRQRTRVLTFFLALIPIAVVLALATVPVAQSQVVTFQVTNPGNFIDTTTYVLTLEHPGTYSFSWWTSDGTNASLIVRDATGGILYSQYAPNGSTTITILGPSSLAFGTYTQLADVVTVYGTYSFAAPLL